MFLRLSNNGKLIEHPVSYPYLACAERVCRKVPPKPWEDPQSWEIHIKGTSHQGCIQMVVTEGRSVTCVCNDDEHGLFYIVNGFWGDFFVKARWGIGHSPYPEIIGMTCIVFGQKYVANFPKEPDDYLTICSVSIKDDGRVYVNGNFVGIYPHFALPDYVDKQN